MNIQKKLHIWGNSLGLVCICAILIVAFAEQLLKHSLPCPLCILQRICFAGIGICLMINLRSGFKPSHYGLMLLQALLGLAIAARQFILHAGPNDPGYGSPFLGLYFYTWSALIFLLIIGFIAVALTMEQGLDEQYKTSNKGLLVLMGFFLFLILANGISTFLECGPYICPDNPTTYYFFK
jgi:disulfide bond formation protein DsbB